ncbi:MAG: hypothetical protein IMX01_08885, partial [Limnochordaceae bacterium]|nr:hypothetical protein [Limnochordaceae bacterium]
KVFKAISAVQERIVRVDRAEGAGPEYQEVNQIMAENLHSFYLGKTSAQAAMENAKRQIDALLARQAGQ